MNEREKILEVQSASKIYRMGEVDVAALRDASLEVFDGEFLVIVGPSGSERSTLLNLVGGMDRPTSDRVIYYGADQKGNTTNHAGLAGENGEDLSAASDARLTQYRRNEIGFSLQFFNLIPTLTATENIQVATEVVKNPLDPIEALGLVGLEDRANHFPSQLSGGQQIGRTDCSALQRIAGSERRVLRFQGPGRPVGQTARNDRLAKRPGVGDS